MDIQFFSHEKFKELAGVTKAVVRADEVLPFANIILYLGVIF